MLFSLGYCMQSMPNINHDDLMIWSYMLCEPGLDICGWAIPGVHVRACDTLACWSTRLMKLVGKKWYMHCMCPSSLCKFKNWNDFCFSLPSYSFFVGYLPPSRCNLSTQAVASLLWRDGPVGLLRLAVVACFYMLAIPWTGSINQVKCFENNFDFWYIFWKIAVSRWAWFTCF